MVASAAQLAAAATAATVSATQAAWLSLPAYWLGTAANVAVVITAFVLQRRQRVEGFRTQERQAEIDEERRLRARREMGIGALSAAARGAHAISGYIYRCEHETNLMEQFADWADDLDFQQSVVGYYLDRDIDDVEVVTILLRARSLLGRARASLKSAVSAEPETVLMPIEHLKDAVLFLSVQATTHKV